MRLHVVLLYPGGCSLQWVYAATMFATWLNEKTPGGGERLDTTQGNYKSTNQALLYRWHAVALLFSISSF
jgi:hypothetical protein